jgi:hypothetical protein
LYSSREKVSKIRLGMVVHFCNSSNKGDIGRRIAVEGQPWAKSGRPNLKNS